ncbi:MAG: CPBP family intramembrane metalloprotease [Candidatus Omnitrophica bacterium]|nr:CPBP family intramembrane metalloprotease [Candidatus Omnitrophota bacterium]
MKSFLKFILIFGLILLLSALLAPWLFSFLPFKFERIFNRLVMIFSLTSIVLFVRIRREDWDQYGLRCYPWSFSEFLKGFVAGVLILVALTVYRVGAGFSQVSFSGMTAWGIAVKLIQFTFSGLLIALIEEFFFRGFTDQSLRIRFRFPVLLATGVTSLFYASLHFVTQKKIWIDQTPDFFDSLKLMASPFLSLTQPGIWPAFTGLFLFGIVLHHLRLSTQSLYAGMGLHAGCVFFVKSDGIFVDGIQAPSLWMGSKVFYDGMAGWFSILLLGVILHLWISPKTFKKNVQGNVL